MGLKSKISDLYEGIIGSLDNKKNSGYSARKLTGFSVNFCILLIHFSWLKHAFLREDYEYIIEILAVDSIFVLLLLGIVTMEQVSQLKNGKREVKKEE